MSIEELMIQVEDEIRTSKILQDDKKDEIVTQILKELEQPKPVTWFNCKMILFMNRYDTISKEKFFHWLFSTHLQELVERQSKGGK